MYWLMAVVVGFSLWCHQLRVSIWSGAAEASGSGGVQRAWAWSRCRSDLDPWSRAVSLRHCVALLCSRRWGGAISDTAIRPSVCLSHGAAVLGYRHAGCLQLIRVRTADPSADGRRSAASRTAVGGGHIVSPPGAITSLLLWCAVKKLLEWKHRHLGPNLQNILRQSYSYLTIMPKLRSTYDGRLIYKTSCKGSKAFLRYDSLAIL